MPASPSAAEKRSTVARTVAKLTMTLGAKIDALHALREEKRALEAKITEIEGKYKGIEEELMTDLDAQGLAASRGTAASCSITTSVSGNVENWDDFNKFVKKTGYFHLYQRRISELAYREMLEQGKPVPGVVPFTKKKLNLRAL